MITWKILDALLEGHPITENHVAGKPINIHLPAIVDVDAMDDNIFGDGFVSDSERLNFFEAISFGISSIDGVKDDDNAITSAEPPVHEENIAQVKETNEY